MLLKHVKCLLFSSKEKFDFKITKHVISSYLVDILRETCLFSPVHVLHILFQNSIYLSQKKNRFFFTVNLLIFFLLGDGECMESLIMEILFLLYLCPIFCNFCEQFLMILMSFLLQLSFWLKMKNSLVRFISMYPCIS